MILFVVFALLPSVLAFVPLAQPLPAHYARAPHPLQVSTPVGGTVATRTPAQTGVARSGLFGLGGPEIAVIIAVGKPLSPELKGIASHLIH